MTDPSRLLLEYARVERKRTDEGLTVEELERWSFLKHRLNYHFSPGLSPRHVDRRNSVRIPTRVRCSFESFGNFERALITNLSCGGVFISTVSPLPIGTRLRMRIHLAQSGAEVELRGVVVSHNVGPAFGAREKGMGVRFSETNLEIAKQIRELYTQEIQCAVDEARQPGQCDSP